MSPDEVEEVLDGLTPAERKLIADTYKCRKTITNNSKDIGALHKSAFGKLDEKGVTHTDLLNFYALMDIPDDTDDSDDTEEQVA